ncbi:MAG: type II toxin-antitoxin system RelE/ParE family toxin [Acidobacteriota bacterium]
MRRRSEPEDEVVPAGRSRSRAQVLITREAETDLVELWVHIAGRSFRAADNYVNLIRRRCSALARTRGLGRLREELAPGLRSFPVGNHVVFYRPAEYGIQVIRVLHGARDIDAIFARERQAY